MTTENPEEPTRPESEAQEPETSADAPQDAAPEEPGEPAASAAEEGRDTEAEPEDAAFEDEEPEDEEPEDEEPEDEEPAAADTGTRAERPTRRRGGPQVATGLRGEGYRGSLPPKSDRIAGPWVILVIAIFVLVLLFSALGIPSSLFTASPTAEPTFTPSGSVAPAASGSVGPSLVPSSSP